MSVRLTIKSKGHEGAQDKHHSVVLNDDAILFGRQEDCQVVLAQKAVSRHHAKIAREGTLYFLEDLDSTYGTHCNGVKLPKTEKRLLRNGDVIGIGQFDITFATVIDLPDDSHSDGNLFLSRKAVKSVLRGLGDGVELPFFRVMNGPNEGHKIELQDAQEYVFGRDDNADIVLMDDLVSRLHAKVRRDWSGTHIEDLGSRNGIRLNKKPTLKATLHNRDEVEIGAMRLLYVDPEEVLDDSVNQSMSRAPSGEFTVAVPPSEDSGASKADDAGASLASESVADEDAARASIDAASLSVDQGSESLLDGAGQSMLDGQEGAQEDAGSSFPPDPEGHSENSELTEGDFGSQGPRKLIDFSNRQTLVVLGIVGAMVLIAVVFLVLLIVGA
jgi:pSer/pThr/pTyr-binding forkhead associated (FHA) protein